MLNPWGADATLAVTPLFKCVIVTMVFDFVCILPSPRNLLIPWICNGQLHFDVFFLLPPSLLKIFGWAMLTLCCRVYWHLLVALRQVWRVFHFARLVVSLDILAIRTSLKKSVTCSKEFWSNVVILSFAVFLMKTNCTVCCQKTVSCFLLVVKAFINFQLFLN